MIYFFHGKTFDVEETSPLVFIGGVMVWFFLLKIGKVLVKLQSDIYARIVEVSRYMFTSKVSYVRVLIGCVR